MDPKRLVADGYDRLHGVYSDWGGGHGGMRHHYIDRAFALGLRPPAGVLDLGCGTGRHASAYLLECGLDVTGLDISPASIKVAQTELPGATFMVGDMATADLPVESFDLVTAFFSLIHLPRTEHAGMLVRIASWLRSGGFAVLTMGARDDPATTVESWLDTAPMYWSSWDAETNRHLVADAGLDVIDADIHVQEEEGQKVAFLWIVARKLEPAS